MCEATVNISGITPQSQTATETVRVQSKFTIKCYRSAMIIFFQFQLQRFQSETTPLLTMEQTLL